MEDHAGAEFDRALAAELRAELAVQRRTASDMAGVLGIAPHTIGRRLAGKSSFSVIEMATAAEWLGMTPEVLARRAERRASRSLKALARKQAAAERRTSAAAVSA